MWIAKRAEHITLITVALLAILVSLLDLLGALDGVEWLRARIPMMTMLVAGLILGRLAIQQVTARQDMEEALGSAVSEAIKAASGIEKHDFNNLADYWRYLSDRLSMAQTCVDDLTWGEPLTPAMTARDEGGYRSYRKQVAKLGAGRGQYQKVLYRELFSFPNDKRLVRVWNLLNDSSPNYHARFFDFDPAGTPPLLQFHIIDRAEVVLCMPAAENTSYLAIRNDALVKLLTDYFNSAWNRALVLKDDAGANTDAIERIRARLRMQSHK